MQNIFFEIKKKFFFGSATKQSKILSLKTLLNQNFLLAGVEKINQKAMFPKILYIFITYITYFSPCDDEVDDNNNYKRHNHS
jgi:hypothetical protein